MSQGERKAGFALALTGTPGVGKTTVKTHLEGIWRGGSRRGLRCVEVRDLLVPPGTPGARGGLPLGEPDMSRAIEPHEGAALGPRRATVVVDMAKAAKALRALTAQGLEVVVVGHLAHLLPVRRIVLLRCRPSELGRRLRARGDPEEWVRANQEAEWTDLILFECLRTGLPVFEHDTSGESPDRTARWVASVVAGSIRPSHGKIDWLSAEPPPPPGSLGRGKTISR